MVKEKGTKNRLTALKKEIQDATKAKNEANKRIKMVRREIEKELLK